jgi:hypothetical protein
MTALTEELAVHELLLAASDERLADRRRMIASWSRALHTCDAPLATRALFLERAHWLTLQRLELSQHEGWRALQQADVDELRARIAATQDSAPDDP